MPTQAMHLFAVQKMRRDAFIGLQHGDWRDEERVSRRICCGLIGGCSLERRGRIAQRGTLLRGRIDVPCRRVLVSL